MFRDTIWFIETQFQIKLVRALQDEHGVKITIQKTSPDVCIRIEGRKADTAYVKAEIVNVFRQVEQDAKDNMLASVMAKQVICKHMVLSPTIP